MRRRLRKYCEELKVPQMWRSRRNTVEHFLFGEAAGREARFDWICPTYLEAVEGDKQPQDVIGAFEDAEYSEVSHHSLHSAILQVNNTGVLQEEKAAGHSKETSSGCK